MLLGSDFCYRVQEAERKFASNLLALYKNIRGVVNLREDLSHGIERPAELTVGRFGGIDVRAFICPFFCFFFLQSLSCRACHYCV